MWFRKRPSAELPADWRSLVARHVKAWWTLDDDERDVVVGHLTDLVTTRRWESANGFDLTDRMRVVIGAQAGVLALGLPDDCYRDVGTIIVHPTTLRVERTDAGPVEGTETCGSVDLLGEAVFDGPIVIAWDAASTSARHPERGTDVVFHELAHKVDMLDGIVDGTPPLLPGPFVDRWIDVNTEAFDALEAADGDDPVIDDYAATDAGEFFAVVTEHFLCIPDALAEAHPDLYDVYREVYGQDPLARLDRPPRRT